MPPPTWWRRRASSSPRAASRPPIRPSSTWPRRRSPSSACRCRQRWRATRSWRRRSDGGGDTRARRRRGRRARGGGGGGRSRGARGPGPPARPRRGAPARPGAGGGRRGGGGGPGRGRGWGGADHLSCYGSAAVKTPHIDALAADGLRWVNTFSQASWTRPSVATILTGLYPSSHGAIHKADRLPDRVDTLAEVLGRAGYHTVGFADNANVSQAFNFQQGFDEYRYLAPDFFFAASEPAAQLALYSGLRLVRERFFAHYVDVHHYYQPAEVVTAEVQRWLDRGARAEPFFLFAHYMDPHDPYFAHPFNGEGYARVAHPNPPPALTERLHHPYEGEG